MLHKLYPNVYRDDNHKPEMALALTEFEALCGFISVKVRQKSSFGGHLVCIFVGHICIEYDHNSKEVIIIIYYFKTSARMSFAAHFINFM